MDKIIEYLRRKSQVLYDLNCIEKYIKGGDYDLSLKKVWDEYNLELVSINEKIEQLKKPQIIEYENKKLELNATIQWHQKEIEKLNSQLNDIDEMIKELNK